MYYELPAQESKEVFSLTRHVPLATPSSVSSATLQAGRKSTYLEGGREGGEGGREGGGREGGELPSNNKEVSPHHLSEEPLPPDEQWQHL